MSNFIDEVVDKKISEMQGEKNIYSIGYVGKIKEYMIEVTGLENACFFERVTITGKGEGYVDKISRDRVTVAMTRLDAPLQIGDEVVSTGEEFFVNYSPSSIGRVIDMFGNDKLAGKKFKEIIKLSVETSPVPIMDRSAVCRPMQTGVVGIDMLYPIGRGQRQLIIGDKKTGKSQIALDTIVNQKDTKMLCIYIAVGKTKKEVKEVYAELYRRGAMDYTIIIAAFNDECPPVLRNTPYAGLSIAEHYREMGLDVLVVIDDLKRHADVCREISLISGKVPGRDAYPSDIFYTHASLLEKGCQHKNGGSITILPICETKSGDITDYIATNIISITDGQIVLSTKSFERGQKPAINYGLSVSRLGGAVQTKEIKKLGAQVRQELLEYLEQREIFELANMDEMGAELKEKMRRGKLIENKLIQYKFSPKTPNEMIRDFEEVHNGEEL